MKEPIGEESVRVAELVSKYIQGDISVAEYDELMVMVKKCPTLRSWIDNQDIPLEEAGERLTDYQAIDVEKEWQSVLEKYRGNTHGKKERRIWWTVAAAMIAVCLVGGSLLLNNTEENRWAGQDDEITEIAPGRSVAKLTLSDGTTTLLEGQGNQTLKDGDMTLAISGATLDYRTATNAHAQLHKLQVPLGGTYHIQLADGTNVWLNADSELEFPSAFTGDDRIVEVRGEAYFEIAKDPDRPFKVQVGETEVEALGTAFNINTHLHAGKTKTILTAGKIKVSTPEQHEIIQPGYAVISGNGGMETGKADIEEAVAWKEGYFYFNSKGLKDVLHEVARWYKLELDIAVMPAEDKRYIGGIKKSESIEAVCSILSDLSAYHITVEGKKITVSE